MATVRQINIHNDPSLISFKENINNRYGPGFNINIRKLENLFVKLAHSISHFNFLTKVLSLNLFPKGFRIKAPYSSHKSKFIIEKAMRSLIKERIKFHRGSKFKLFKEINLSLTFLKDKLLPDDFNNITSSIRHKHQRILRKLSEKHGQKLNNLLVEQNNSFNTPTLINKNFVVNLSDHSLSEAQARILNKGLKFALPMKKLPTLELISSIESGIHNLSEEEKSDLRCRLKPIIDKKITPKPVLTKEEKTH